MMDKYQMEMVVPELRYFFWVHCEEQAVINDWGYNQFYQCIERADHFLIFFVSNFLVL